MRAYIGAQNNCWPSSLVSMPYTKKRAMWKIVKYYMYIYLENNKLLLLLLPLSDTILVSLYSLQTPDTLQEWNFILTRHYPLSYPSINLDHVPWSGELLQPCAPILECSISPSLSSLQTMEISSGWILPANCRVICLLLSVWLPL